MPPWRVSQCLPAVAASFDLVVLDEASQSDVTYPSKSHEPRSVLLRYSGLAHIGTPFTAL